MSLRSALDGRADIALGNVVGSNIFNVLLILGLSALIAPLAVSRKLVRLEVPLMIGASLLLAALGVDGRIGRLEGAVQVSLGVAWHARRGDGEPGNGKGRAERPASGHLSSRPAADSGCLTGR